MLTAQESLQRLRAGNRRFVADAQGSLRLSRQEPRSNLEVSQQPFAIILGCSDSRVPPEFIFDQGLGDLFVIRIAGNIVAPSQMASIEFAAMQFDTPLIVVLGHSGCGAVAETINDILEPKKKSQNHLSPIADRIRPVVESLLEMKPNDEPDSLLQHAIHANVRSSIYELQTSSGVLQKLIKDQNLIIVGAEYSLETGVVNFFENNKLTEQ